MLEWFCALFGCGFVFLVPVAILFALRPRAMRAFARDNGLRYEWGIPFLVGARATGIYEGERIQIRIRHNWHRRYSMNTFAFTYFEVAVHDLVPLGLDFAAQTKWFPLKSPTMTGLPEVDKRLYIRSADPSAARPFFSNPAVQGVIFELASRGTMMECVKGWLSVRCISNPTTKQLEENFALLIWAARSLRAELWPELERDALRERPASVSVEQEEVEPW